MNLDQQRLGEYVLAEQLRQDRTGTVYRGLHATSQTEVAVKVLHERYGKDPAVVARFRREAKTLGRVEHPGIAAVVDHGESPHGLFVVSEILVGESLADRLERLRRLSVAETQEIVGAVASALAVAHRARVVHRDLKADSIFLVRADAGSADAGSIDAGMVKVLDLGLAKVLGDHADANNKDVDQRADIQALGSVAYELLSGHAPLVVGYQEGRPRAARLSTHGVTVPASIEAAIMKALERKKKRRFSSMADFARAFGVDIGPVAAPAPEAAPQVESSSALEPSLVPQPPPVPRVVARTETKTVPLAPGPERSTTLAGLVAPLRDLGRTATGRRQIVAVVGAVSAAALVIIWLGFRAGGPSGPVANEVNPPPAPPAQQIPQPPAQPTPPRPAPSRVDDILALNQKAVSAYAHSDIKTARALLQEADKLAVANGYQDAMVRAQTQVRLGALSIAGEKNPRVGRRYLAKAIAINPAVKLPADMTTPQVRRALHSVRAKSGLASGKVRKHALNGKSARRHGREHKRAR